MSKKHYEHEKIHWEVIIHKNQEQTQTPIRIILMRAEIIWRIFNPNGIAACDNIGGIHTNAANDTRDVQNNDDNDTQNVEFENKVDFKMKLHIDTIQMQYFGQDGCNGRDGKKWQC